MSISPVSDQNSVGLQTAPNANYWTVANLTGSFFTTAWQSLLTDNSPADVDYVFVNNVASGANPVGGVYFPVNSVLPTQRLWRLKIRAKLTAAYTGANSINFFLYNFHLATLTGGGAFQTSYNIADTPSPGSWVTINIDFDTDPSLSIGAGGPNSPFVSWQFLRSDEFSMGFYITHMQLFSLGPGYVASPENDVALNFNYLMHDFNEHGKSID